MTHRGDCRGCRDMIIEPFRPALERYDLGEVVDEVMAVGVTIGRMGTYLKRGLRAREFSLSNEVTRYEAEVRRDAHLLRLEATQLRVLLEERTQRRDWERLKHRADRFLQSPQGSAARGAIREHVALRLIDVNAPPQNVVEALSLWSRMDDGLEHEGVQHLVSGIMSLGDRASSFADRPEQMLEPASPLELGPEACIAAAAFVSGISLAACCGTCLLAVAAGFALKVADCLS